MAVQIILHWAEDEIQNTGWMPCDEQYILEDKDAEFLFKITNEHIAAVLLPISLARL